MLAFAVEHDVRPQVEVMPLARINEALDRVRDGKARYRVVVEMPESEPSCARVCAVLLHVWSRRTRTNYTMNY